MKKILLFLGVILLFGIIPLFVSCDPCLGAYYHKGEWYVKNRTEEALNINYSLGGQALKVVPGDSVKVDYLYAEGCYNPNNLVNFYSRLERYGKKYSVKVLSEEGVLLKQWEYSDKYLPGRQFFNESFWHKCELPANGREPIKVVWTFDILSEDISSE